MLTKGRLTAAEKYHASLHSSYRQKYRLDR